MINGFKILLSKIYNYKMNPNFQTSESQKVKGLKFCHRGQTMAMFILFFTLIMSCSSKKKPVGIPVFSETKISIKKGENLEIALNKLLSYNVQLTNSIINILNAVDFPFKKCLPGDSIKIIKKDNKFVEFTYYKNPTLVYYVQHNSQHLTVAMKFPYIDTVKCFLKGTINSTLYESILEIGENPEMVFRFADIFAWEIDFTTETQEGDSFYILLEKTFCDAKFISYSHISFLRYKGLVGDYYGIYYKDSEGDDDYYNLKGESLRKSLLKSPLKYSYISSYFSKKRFHPILKIWRPHHGLDYSAPIGAPVSSIGDGTVTYKGWRGGYGNLVEIRHKNNFKTRYGHLSRFAKGLNKSKRVKMGEIIGYVGSTGLSTGPHLHFELHKDGAPINPLKVKLPRAPSVKKQYFKQFEQVRDSLLLLIANNQMQVSN